MNSLSQGQHIGDYTVDYIIKTNPYCETYRVADADGQPFFLKLFVLKNMPDKLVAPSGTVREIENCRCLQHRYIISYITDGAITLDNVGQCQYMVSTYFSGDLLVERVQRNGTLPAEQAKHIAMAVAETLKYLHREHRLLHNDITPRNIMLSDRTDGDPELIDMGHLATPTAGVPPFDTADLEVEYCANTTFSGWYDECSDIYSLVAVLYFMLTGHAPWQLSASERKERIREIKQLRKSAVDLSGIDDEGLRRIIGYGLSPERSERFTSAEQLLQALADPDNITRTTPSPQLSGTQGSTTNPTAPRRGNNDNHALPSGEVNIAIHRGGGNGFKDIAGMDELKQFVTTRVIALMKDPEKNVKYRITPPNGILLYGAPGCGKTFFAEKFAEESGLNFMLVKHSDVTSSFLHDTQNRIAQLFDLAAKNAPIVMCFDEFDAFVPDRNNDWGNNRSEEVNAFLSQMNNCAQRGIFIVAMSNRPNKIDPAILRTGRIDRRIYVPLPDRVARRELFRIHLNDRPCNDIDFERLAEISERYVASDIAYVVNEAAIIAAYNNTTISQQLLETTLTSLQPSNSEEQIRQYELMRKQMETDQRRGSIPRVGFKIDN